VAQQDESRDAIDTSEIEALVKIFDKEVPLEALRTNLRKVAESRRLQGATIDITLLPDAAKPDYYNVYRYAFFGMLPPDQVDVLPATQAAADTFERFQALRKK
jgi:hypothetical protein